MEEKSRISQGVSFEPDVLELAKKTATQRRQSLSAYINGLIAADCGCELSPTSETAAKAEGEVSQ